MDQLFSLRGRRTPLGCALLAAHWGVLVVVGFAVTILAAPVFAVVFGAAANLGVKVDPEFGIFYLMVPAVAVVAFLAARRINRRIDRAFGLGPAPTTTHAGADLGAELAELDARFAPPPGSEPAGSESVGPRSAGPRQS